MGFKAGERSKDEGITSTSSAFEGHKMSSAPITEAPSGDLGSKIEVESDEEALADGEIGSVQTNGPCKMVP